MKKFLFGILTLIGIGFSFCSADGIYRSQSLGLISVVSNGITVYTISDKNLGATSVYNDDDSLSESNCGNYFQWGNNYGFPFLGTLSNISTGGGIDVSNYGPGNYYSSNVFIKGQISWSSPFNGNLWGNTTNTLEARQGPCPFGFHVPILDEFNSLNNVLINFGLSSAGNTFKTYLKVPLCGYRIADNPESPNSQGVGLFYWCSSISPYGGGVKPQYFYGNGSRLYFTQYGNSTNSMSLRCFRNSVVEPEKPSWSVLYGDSLPDLLPKFKVNYGSTSYEYELDSDLNIYLKSATVQSGNTFTYAGSTGINLFYNGSSQFYNKDKLYLSSMYWYNNNIFTPICL